MRSAHIRKSKGSIPLSATFWKRFMLQLIWTISQDRNKPQNSYRLPGDVPKPISGIIRLNEQECPDLFEKALSKYNRVMYTSDSEVKFIGQNITQIGFNDLYKLTGLGINFIMSDSYKYDFFLKLSFDDCEYFI
jgi:hypothetical protein